MQRVKLQAQSQAKESFLEVLEVIEEAKEGSSTEGAAEEGVWKTRVRFSAFTVKGLVT